MAVGSKLLKVTALLSALGVLVVVGFGVATWLDERQLRKQLRTMVDMRTIGAAVEAYRSEHGTYPRSEGDTVAGLAPSLEPTYARPLPTTDAWGHGLQYRQVRYQGWSHDGSPAEQAVYTIESYGKDGVPSGPASGAVDSRAHDIVFSTGSFLTWPSDNLGY